MAYDAAGTQFEVKPVVLSDRARFALDLAKHANEPYGERGQISRCALAKFFGGTHHGLMYPNGDWRGEFIDRYDMLKRATGFDCLAILNSIPDARAAA